MKFECECGEVFSSGWVCPVCGSEDVEVVATSDRIRAQKKRDHQPSEED